MLDVIEEQHLINNAKEVGDYIRRGFARLAECQALIGDIRGEGLWVGVELVRDRQTKEPAAAETSRLVNLLKNAGILVSRIGEYDNVLKIRPPLIFSRENADELLDAVSSCIQHL